MANMLLHCNNLHPFTSFTSFHRIPFIHRQNLHPSAAETEPSELRYQNNSQDPPIDRSVQLPAQDRLKLLQLSTSHKRTPQFPGSVSSFETLKSVPGKPEGLIDDNSEEMIMHALSVRRKAATEIFKEAMKQGKFGITYTTSLAGEVSGFIDYVMIEAAAMKRLPMFMNASFNVRAEAVIQDSNVVPLIRWLKHNNLSYPQIGKLICMSKGNLESVRRVVQWLKSIHVNGRFLGVALGRAGEKMLRRNSHELDEIVEYLESYGVRRDWMGYVMSRSPQLLSYTMEEIKERVDFYLDMGMNKHDFGTMVFEYPKVLGYFSMEEMNQKVNYLKEFGLDTESVGKLLAFKPQLMACSIEDRWKPLVRYLYYLGISRDGMKRMLVIKPMVFCVSLEEIIVPKVRFFQDIGIRNEAIGKMLVKFPPLLTYSLHKKIRPVVIFLMTKAGVSKTDIAKVIALAPELLGCSIYHKLEPNFKYFLSLGIKLHQLGQMIADFPMLLRYNVELLRPKYRYLRRTMVRPLKDLIEFPRFMSYSLEGRIIPRHRVLIENRVNFKLRYMLASTDEEFEKRVKAAVERRLRFESGNSNANGIEAETEDDDFSGNDDEDESFSSASDDSESESDESFSPASDLESNSEPWI